MIDNPGAEEWRPVAGCEGIYDVSNLGRVRSLARVNRKGQPVRGRILKQLIRRDGRPQVNASLNGVRKTFHVHRLVATAFLGEPRPGEVVCHGDGDPANNAARNLRWDTRSSNNLDSVRHGTHRQARKTQCTYGHPLEGENLVRAQLALGWRSCRSCQRARSWFRHRPNADRANFQAVADAIYERL